MAEFIEKTDTLNEGREKLNAAIQDAEDAKITAEDADYKATQALAKSESTQTQLDTIVIDGDSSVEAAQARVDENGVAHATLKARIDDGFEKTKQQLVQIGADIDSRAVNILKYSHLVDNGDWSIALQTIADEGKMAFIPKGEFNFSETIYFDSGFGVIGEDTDNSILRNTSPDNICFSPRNKGIKSTEWAVFKTFRLRGYGNTGIGIDLTHCEHSEVYKVYIDGFAVGVKLESIPEVGLDRCYYNTIHHNRIRARDYGVWLTGHKPNANRVEFNRFSNAGTGEHIGIFVDIDRGKGHGPVNTLTLRENNFHGLIDSMRIKYIVSSTIEGNRFENCTNGIHWDRSALASMRKLKISNNHYGTNVNAWVNTPNIDECMITESAEDLEKTLPTNYSYPNDVEVFGEVETSSIVHKDVIHDVKRFGRAQQFTHSTRVEAGKTFRIRFKSGFPSTVFMRVQIVGDHGSNEEDRIIGMSKEFMFGLGLSSITSIQTKLGSVINLENTDLTITHTGVDYTFDLRFKNNTIRNHSTTFFVEIVNSRNFVDDDGRIKVLGTIIDD